MTKPITPNGNDRTVIYHWLMGLAIPTFNAKARTNAKIDTRYIGILRFPADRFMLNWLPDGTLAGYYDYVNLGGLRYVARLLGEDITFKVVGADRQTPVVSTDRESPENMPAWFVIAGPLSILAWRAGHERRLYDHTWKAIKDHELHG